MRKARLYALTLAAVMAVSAAPVYTYGASEEDVVVTSEGEENSEGETTEEPDSEEDDTVTVETPVETTPTETPADPTEPATPTEGAQPTPEAGSEEGSTTKTIQLKGDNLNSVLEEIKTVQEKDIVLEVTEEVAVKTSCEIKPAEGKTLKIKRSSSYSGNMFKVASGVTLTVSNVTMDGASSAAGKGGAVIYSEGTVVLRSCTITGNASDSGAVYLSGTNNLLSGSLSITGNKTADKASERNVYLASGASFNVDSAWNEGSKVGVTSAKTDAGTVIYKVTGTKVASVNDYLTCENTGYTIQYDEASKTAVLSAESTPTVSADAYDATKHKEENVISGVEASYAANERMVFTVAGAGLNRENPKPGDTAYVPTYAAMESADGTQYSIGNFGLKENGEYGGSARLTVSAGSYKFIVKYDLRQWGDTTDSWENATVVTKDAETVSQAVEITQATEPTPAAGYDATQHQDENQILGVTSSYKQNSRLSFTIEGAGLDREDPQAGDTAYVPVTSILTCSDGTRYSIAVNEDGGKYTGSATLSKSKVPTGNATLTVYYELRQWSEGINSWADAQVADGLEENGQEEVTASKTFRVTAASTTNTKRSSGTTKKKSKSSTSKTSKAKNADTADETPILPLAGLCTASVLAGGLVIVRKRKMDQE